MAAPRANWRGFLQIGALSCAVGLFTAASTSERLRFNMINRATGNRMNRQFVDSVTGAVVDSADQIKGYEISEGRYLPFEDDEIAAVMPQSDKSLLLESFIPCDQVDTIYFDRPYYLAPSDKASEEVFALIREGLLASSTVGLARTVLFRRLRVLVIRPNPLTDNDRDRGMIATTLHYDYEVRRAAEVFDDLPAVQTSGEMIDLARHIIETKSGHFHPSEVTDRYEEALAALIRAKTEGRALPKAPAARTEKVVDLLEALRASAGVKAAGKSGGGKTGGGKAAGKTGGKTATGKAGTGKAATGKAAGKAGTGKAAAAKTVTGTGAARAAGGKAPAKKAG